MIPFTAVNADEFKPEEFKEIKFNKDEQEFLRILAEQNKALDHLTILFGLAAIVNAPKTPEDLVNALVARCRYRNSPELGRSIAGRKRNCFSQGGRKCSVVLCWQIHSSQRQKATTKNFKFFEALQNHYISMIRREPHGDCRNPMNL